MLPHKFHRALRGGGAWLSRPPLLAILETVEILVASGKAVPSENSAPNRGAMLERTPSGVTKRVDRPQLWPAWGFEGEVGAAARGFFLGGRGLVFVEGVDGGQEARQAVVAGGGF